jgi:hypothetical protein
MARDLAADRRRRALQLDGDRRERLAARQAARNLFALPSG